MGSHSQKLPHKFTWHVRNPYRPYFMYSSNALLCVHHISLLRCLQYGFVNGSWRNNGGILTPPNWYSDGFDFAFKRQISFHNDCRFIYILLTTLYVDDSFSVTSLCPLSIARVILI